MSRTTHLKIKIKTLAIESTYIRAEERKVLRAAAYARNAEHAEHEEPRDVTPLLVEYTALHQHRTRLVRRSARASLLAYGFLRGTPYHAMEASTRPGNAPDWKAVEHEIKRFGGDATELPAWYGLVSVPMPAMEQPTRELVPVLAG